MSRQPAAEHTALPQHAFGPERAAVSFDDAVGIYKPRPLPVGLPSQAWGGMFKSVRKTARGRLGA